MWSHWHVCNIFLVFIKWNIDEIIQTFIPTDLKINILIYICCPKQHIKTVHFLKILKTTRTKSYFLISPYRIPNYLNEDTWVVYGYGKEVIFVGEQWGATGSHVTGRGPVRNQKYVMCMPLVGSFHQKWRQWPEVIVCACPTGTFCITTRIVVQVPVTNPNNPVVILLSR
jgi:hypothetical protein